MNKPMLKSGDYRCEVIKYFDKTPLLAGTITLEVTETTKMFYLTLKSFDVKYDAPQIEDMFREKDSIKINKFGSKHAIQVWGDEDFTLYPHRVSVPYHFKFERDLL